VCVCGESDLIRFGIRHDLNVPLCLLVLPLLSNYHAGPCPILALINVLSLRGHIAFHPQQQAIEFGDMVQKLNEFLQRRLETLSSASDITEERLANLLSNFEAACATLPRLEVGLGV
jgi:hypothetical protein